MPGQNQNQQNQGAPPPQKITYGTVNKRFVVIGRRMATLASNTTVPIKQTVTLNNNTKPLDVQDFSSKKRSLDNTSFGGYFRGLNPGQDELVSTASVRGMMTGAVEDVNMPPNKRQRLNESFNYLSSFRMDTNVIGFNMKNSDEALQHPTTSGTEFWMDGTEDTKNLHNRFDLMRSSSIADAMEQSLNNGDDLQTVLDKAGQRSLTATVNSMWAAPTSDTQNTLSNRTTQEINEATLKRENAKNLATVLGADRQGGNSTLQTSWNPSQNELRVSPSRTSVQAPTNIPPLTLSPQANTNVQPTTHTFTLSPQTNNNNTHTTANTATLVATATHTPVNTIASTPVLNTHTTTVNTGTGTQTTLTGRPKRQAAIKQAGFTYKV